MEPAPAFIGIVLAAGSGDTMGGHKGLVAVRWGEGPGELPLAIAHARAMLDGGAERVLIVARSDAARVLLRFGQRGLDILASNLEADFGPAASVQSALRFLSLTAHGPCAYMITPVGLPPASGSIRQALLGAMAKSADVSAVRATFEGKRGYPILVRDTALEAFLTGAAPSVAELSPAELPPLDAVLSALDTNCVDVPVIDPRATTDLDTPEQVEAWYHTPVRFFSPDDDR
ncbi:MAG: NTP transferase domain-containing protein [Polyangiaceae bacterium]